MAVENNENIKYFLLMTFSLIRGITDGRNNTNEQTCIITSIIKNQMAKQMDISKLIIIIIIIFIVVLVYNYV